MNPLYLVIADRARHRCEYCRAPETIFNFRFEVEHITPIILGGSNDSSNLALACRSCNAHKGDRLEAIDELTSNSIRLFHPRGDSWDEHFRFDPDTGSIVGMTAVGRASVKGLCKNTEVQKQARKQWMRLGLFP